MIKKIILAVVAAVLVMTVCIPFDALAVSYASRGEIPDRYKWNLRDIYPNKAAWERDLQTVEREARQFQSKYQGKLASSPQLLLQALNDYSNLMRKNDKAYVYAKLAFDVNMANDTLQQQLDQAEKVNVALAERTSWLVPEIVAIPESEMKKILGMNEFAQYKFFIEDLLRTKSHTLSKEMEQLLAKLSPVSETSENVYAMLSKDVTLPKIMDENGKEVQLNPANFIRFMESKNRTVRKAAFQAYYYTLDHFRDTFAQTLVGEVKANDFYANARHYPSALEASLTANNIPVKVYDQLIQTVNRNLPLLHRYLELKKRVLGVKELHMYDIYTPTEENENRHIPYDQAKEMVLAGLKPWGEEYLKVLAEGFQNGWIDVYSTPDKRTGAYQWGAYDTHPYVLLNYQGTRNDVSTIAHELGHAMQSYFTNKKQPYISSGYPIFTAEVASTLNETLLFKSMYANAKTKQEKMSLLSQYLEHFRTTLFRQTQFAEFEKLIHEKEAAGEPLTADSLKSLYLELNKKYYGNGTVSDAEIAMEWARIPHFYKGFYVYQYATSFAASTALARQMLTEGEPAVQRIRHSLLEAGNSAAPLDVLKAAGVDMSTSKPIEQAIQVFAETLDEWERLLNEK
ncbi:oligoendopeptidase F [Brevibacillus sp. B_LB10_24]|uniref:oligoendopeptidase F n=1 Tax=Brevibacillus sp. B_LB10_24 TaxID=3380645 RepID=UPI0038BD73B3